jgi:hypothetical protein
MRVSLGRVVWYYRFNAGLSFDGPYTAHVCDVIPVGDTIFQNVNLMVIGKDGVPFGVTNIPFIQTGHDSPAGDFCCFPPKV